MRKTETIFLVIIFLFSLYLRLCYNEHGLGILNLASANFDAVDYHWLAKNLVRLRGYRTFWGTGHEYHLLRSPGYPLYAALIYSIVGIRIAALQFADAVLSSFTVILLYLLAKRVFGAGAAVIAALIALLYHQAINFSTRIFSENLFCFLFLLLVYILVRYKYENWSCGAGGLISGCMILIRPLWIGVVPFLFLWIAFSGPKRWARIVLFLAILIVTISPWAFYCVWGLGMEPSMTIFSTTVGAENLWAAQNPIIGDFVQMGPTPGRDFEHEWRQLRLMRFANWQLSESDYIDKFSTQARHFFVSSPARCLALGFRRVYRHWLGSGILDGQGTILDDRGANPIGVIYWRRRFMTPGAYLSDTEVIDQLTVTRKFSVGPFAIPFISFEGVFYVMVASSILFAIFSVRQLPRKAVAFIRETSLFWLIIIGYTLTNVLGATVQRYRFPLDYIVILFCAAGVAGAARSILVALRIIPADEKAERDDAEARALDEIGRRTPARHITRLSILVLLALCLVVSNLTLRAIRAELIRRCSRHCSRDEILAKIKSRPGTGVPEPDMELNYRQAWERQMRGMGDLGEQLGSTVLWTGEATYINTPSKVYFDGEVYLKEARDRFVPHMKDPGFFRLIVDSYREPDSIGSGRVIVVAPSETMKNLREGDRIAVLGTLGGTDYIVGSIIICARAVDKLNR